MAKNLFQKYIYLLDLLHRHRKGLTLVEINQYWKEMDWSFGQELPERTFHRYKVAIQDIFNIEIACDNSNYRYYLPTPEDIDRKNLYNWLLETFSMMNIVHKETKLCKRILCEPQPSSHQYLNTIIVAMDESKLISINHQSYWKKEETKGVVLAPYAVKLFRQRWYLLAKNIAKGELRTYSLDRVKELKVLEESFVFPNDFDACDFFHDSFGIMVDERYPVEDIKIKAYDARVKYIKDLPLHKSQELIEEGKDYAIFELRLRASADFEQELMSFADEIEVLSPEWLRDEMKQRSLQGYNNYEQ